MCLRDTLDAFMQRFPTTRRNAAKRRETHRSLNPYLWTARRRAADRRVSAPIRSLSSNKSKRSEAVSRYSHQPPFHFVSISNLARHGTLPTAKRDSIQTPFPTSQALGIKICNLSIRNLPTDGTSACLRYRISKPIIVGKPQRRRHGFQLSISSSPCFASFGSTI